MKYGLILTLVLSGTVAFAQNKTINKSFDNVKSIKLTIGSGDVFFKKGSGSEVKIQLDYSYNDETYKPIFNQNGSQLIIKEDFEHGNHKGSSKWTFNIPDNLIINFNAGSGDIEFAGVAVDIKSNTGSGDILVSSVSGDLDFNTGSGDVEIEEATGKLHINAGSGDITASKGSGEYSINTGSGVIQLAALKGKFAINTGSGDVTAKALTVAGASSFNTGSGDATVALASPLDHNISVNSGSGDARLNFNGNAINGEVIMTANKKGGEIVAPFSFDKEETIEGDHHARIRKTAKLGDKAIEIKLGTGTGTAQISR